VQLITGIFFSYVSQFTYVPLALSGIPPSIFLAHLQLGELYMFWLHTEVITTIGPLEYILNTPSHHRVHHGRNPKYIDKNYSGVFIIWDRLFGTFEAEDPDEPVVYGLVHPVESYNPFYLQYHHWLHMWRTAQTLPGWKNKLSVIFKGPGWQPGTPRLGNYEDLPKVEQPVTYWDPPMHLLTKAYVILHFTLVIFFYHELTLRNATFTQSIITSGVIALLLSITSVGFMLEER
jgi:alkylglycerol monooxygenase